MASAAEDPYRDEALCCRCGKDDSNYADEMRRLSYCKRCGHSLCQACMAQTFGAIGGGRGRGHTVAMCPAPGCNKTVQVSDFGFKRPEDEEYEAEIKARKYVTSIFNKPESAFGGDAAAYNDYLERVEGYIATLVTGGPEERRRVEAEIAAYASANHTSVAYYRAQQQTAARQTAERLASEHATRAAAATQAATKEADKRRVLDGLKATVKAAIVTGAAAAAGESAAGGASGGRPALSATDAAALKARLLALQAQLRSGEGSTASLSASMLLDGGSRLAETVGGAGSVVLSSASGGAAAAAADSPILMYTPCPAVPLPKLLRGPAEAAHPAARLGVRQHPPPLRARMLRAGGLSVHEALAWNRVECAAEMWPTAAPAVGAALGAASAGSLLSSP